MGSAFACAPGTGAPSSSVAVQRDATASRPEGRAFVSLRPGSRFEVLYRTGVRTRIDGLTVFSGAGADATRPEVGIVASRRVGNAVRRNRIKRRLREAIRLAPTRPGMAYVVVASPEVVDVGFDQLVEWLRRALSADAA
jgi:ribonuclease P protein component